MDFDKIPGRKESWDRMSEMAVSIMADKDPPQVDLSSKDWKFILRYIEESLMKHSLIPINRIFTHFNFGDEFMVHYPYKGQHLNLYVRARRASEESFSIHMRYDTPNGKFTFSSYALFTEAADLEYIPVAESFYTVRGIELIPSTSTDLEGAFPPVFNERKSLIELYFHIVGMFLIMYDRPKRLQMIKETNTRVMTTPSKKKPSEYAVRYILRSAREAKVYVRDNPDSTIIREYIVAQWGKRAHTRRLQSGTVINVRAHDCHRRYDLTEKEIRIRLGGEPESVK
jgi:hypothetical protein